MKKIIIILTFAAAFLTNNAFAQFGEPEVRKIEDPKNLYDEGYRTGFGFNLALTDFGFGAGGQFRFGLKPYTEALVSLKIAGLKDPTEQTFTDFLGYRTTPEKYQRVVSIPLYIGIKQRFFPEKIADNFRLFSSISAGPTFAFSYSYFNDVNENGFRENDGRIYGFTERTNDIFTGWNNSETHWGMGGEFTIGIDFGDNFSNLSTVQFGYTMNYFPNGIQVLQPCKADLSRIGQAPVNPCGVGPDFTQVFFQDQNGDVFTDLAPLEQANDPRKYFGSAQISFIFGWMW